LDQGITGFAAGNVLEFDNYGDSFPADHASLSGSMLTVYDEGGGVLDSVTLQGDYTGDAFSVTQVGTIAEVTVGQSYTPPTPFDWDGATGSFDVPGDWVGNTVPGTADTAGFPSGGTLEGTGTVEAIDVSSDTTFAGTLTSSYGGMVDGGSPGSPDVLTIADGATLDLGGLFVVGSSAAAALDIAAGGTVIDTSFIDLAQRNFGQGTVTVSGVLVDDGALNVGEEGTGSLDIAGGGSVSAAFAILGDVVDSDGYATVEAGGTFSVGSMNIGNYGFGSLTIETGGTVVDSSFVSMGDSFGLGQGVASVSGDWAIASSLNVGGGGSGTLAIGTGGTVSVGSFLSVGQGLDADGTVALSGGGVLDLTNSDPDTLTVSLGGAGGFGTLALDGAQTSLVIGGGGLVDGNDGTGAIDITDGATLSVTNAAPSTFDAMYVGVGTLVSVLDISGPGSGATIGAGGLAVGFNGTAVADISAGGTLSVTDTLRGLEIGVGTGSSGTVTVDGTHSALTTMLLSVGGAPGAGGSGLLIVSNGGLASVSTAATIWSGSTIVLDGGTLDATSLTNASGTLTGSGTIDGAITNDASAQIDVTAGTLDVASGKVVNDGLIAVDGAALTLGVTLSGGGSLVIDGGVALFDRADTFSGGVTLDAGTLDLAAAGAAGSGAITFAATAGLVQFAAAAVPANAFDDFVMGDTIEVIGFKSTGSHYAGGQLTLDGTGGPLTLDIPGVNPLDLVATTSGDDTFVTVDNGPTVVPFLKDLGVVKNVPLDIATYTDPVPLASGNPVIIRAPSRGTLAVSDGRVTYTETLNPTLDQFSYELTDKNGVSSPVQTAIIGAGGTYTITGAASGYTVVDTGGGPSTITLFGSNNVVRFGHNKNTVTDATATGGDNTIIGSTGPTVVSLTGSGGGNSVALGSGKDTITVGGLDNTITLGRGRDVVNGGTGDTISFTGSTKLTLSGLNETVFIGPGGGSVSDHGTGTVIGAGPTATGLETIFHFSADLADGVIDLLGGVGGIATPQAAYAALTSDGKGGSMLSLGGGLTIDTSGVPKAMLSAANFKIG